MWSGWGLGASNMVSVVLRSENLLQWFLDSVHSQYTLPWCSIPCSISMVLHLPGAPLSLPFLWCSITCATSLVLHYLCHLLGAPFPVTPFLHQCHYFIYWASWLLPLSAMNSFFLGVASSLCSGLSQCNSMAVAVFPWLLWSSQETFMRLYLLSQYFLCIFTYLHNLSQKRY